MPDNIS